MGITYGDYLIDSGYYDPPEEEPMPITELADRIEVYLEDAPSSGGHSDAAGADAWELLREAMDELRRLQEAKQRALAIADERSKENVALRAAQKAAAEIERLRANLKAAIQVVLNDCGYDYEILGRDAKARLKELGYD